MDSTVSYIISGEKHPNITKRISLTQSPRALPNVLQKVHPECFTLSCDPEIPGTASVK